MLTRERALQDDDAVITPKGWDAQIIKIDNEGFCRLRYLNGPESGKEVTLHEKLLRRIRPGRGTPPPVRIAVNGRRS